MTTIEYLKNGGTFMYNGRELKKVRYDLPSMMYFCRVINLPPKGRWHDFWILAPSELVTEASTD